MESDDEYKFDPDKPFAGKKSIFAPDVQDWDDDKTFRAAMKDNYINYQESRRRAGKVGNAAANSYMDSLGPPDEPGKGTSRRAREERDYGFGDY